MSVDNPLAIIAIALVVGALDTLLFAAVLRFDLRVVPGFVAAQLVATTVADAMLQQTRPSLAMGALSCALIVAMAWVATRYLLAGRAGRWRGTRARASVAREGVRHCTDTRYGMTWLSARCTALTLLRVAHGMTCRCSGRLFTSAFCAASASRNFLQPRIRIHVDLHLGDEFVQFRIRVAAVVVVAVALAAVRSTAQAAG